MTNFSEVEHRDGAGHPPVSERCAHLPEAILNAPFIAASPTLRWRQLHCIAVSNLAAVEMFARSHIEIWHKTRGF
jgi:hypothetical protein